MEAFRPRFQCPGLSCNVWPALLERSWNYDKRTAVEESERHSLRSFSELPRGGQERRPLSAWTLSRGAPLCGSVGPLTRRLSTFWRLQTDPPWTGRCMGRAGWQCRAAVQASVSPRCLSQRPRSRWTWGSNPAGEKDARFLSGRITEMCSKYVFDQGITNSEFKKKKVFLRESL